MKGLLRANMKAHGARYRGTAIAVALATAFILAAFGLTGAVQYSAQRSVAQEVTGAEGVVANIYPRGTEDRADELGNRILEQIKDDPKLHVEPIYQTRDELHVPGRSETQFIVLGQVKPEPFGNQEVKEGSLPTKAGEIALPEFVQLNGKPAIGDTVSFTGVEGDFKITGFLKQSNGITFGPMGVVASGQIPKIDEYAILTSIIFASDSMSGSEVTEYVRGEISKMSGDFSDFSVENDVVTAHKYVEQQMEGIAEGMSGMLAVALIFPGIAAITAIIVISTTFQVMLAQRKRELALLRAIGADAGQIRRLMIRENLLVGLISSLIGLVLGVGVSVLVNKLMHITSTYLDAFLAIPLWGYIAALIIGVLMTLIAGIRPAMQAGSLSPMVALAPVDSDKVEKSKRLARLITGLVVTIIGAAIIALTVMNKDFGVEPAQFGIAFIGGAVSFIGVLILLTWLVPYITRGFGKLFARSSITVEMAGENTWRNPARTGATGTALTLGVTLVVMMMVGATSVENSILSEIDTKRPIDFVISTDGSEITNAERQRVQDMKHVEQVIESKSFIVEGESIDPDAFEDEPTQLQFIEGRDLSGIAHSPILPPKDGTIGVNGWLWDESETLTFENEGKSLTLDAEVARTPFYTVSPTDYEALRELYGERATDTSVLYIRIEEGLSIGDVSELSSNLTSAVEGGMASGSAEERAAMVMMIRTMLISTIVMLAVSVVVALVGVTNTLALSVVERRRENAMLRALGMTKAGIRKMIRWETLLIAGVSIVIGVALGIGFGAFGVSALPIEGEFTRHIIVPWAQVGGAVAIALIAALLASILPARQAAKASPIEALADIQ